MSYNNSQNTDKKSNSIGALWNKSSKSGMQYMSGRITLNGQTFSIAVFVNGRKTTEKHPDYQIVLSGERGNAAQQAGYSAPAPSTPQHYTERTHVSSPPVHNSPDVAIDEIPY